MQIGFLLSSILFVYTKTPVIDCIYHYTPHYISNPYRESINTIARFWINKEFFDVALHISLPFPRTGFLVLCRISISAYAALDWHVYWKITSKSMRNYLPIDVPAKLWPINLKSTGICSNTYTQETAVPLTTLTTNDNFYTRTT